MKIKLLSNNGNDKLINLDISVYALSVRGGALLSGKALNELAGGFYYADDDVLFVDDYEIVEE